MDFFSLYLEHVKIFKSFFRTHHIDIHERLDDIEIKINNILIILDSQIVKTEDND